MLKSAPITIENFDSKKDNNIASTGMATIDGGYAVIYAVAANDTTTNNSFTIRGRVYANLIPYNNANESRTILLYTLRDNVNFSGIYCDLVAIGVGQVCTITTNFKHINSNGTENNFTTQYIRINFLSSGSLLTIDEPSNLPNITAPPKGWQVHSMSFGGYILHANDNANFRSYYVYAYDQYNIQTPLFSTVSSNQAVPINNFITNTYGAYTITKHNNALLLPTLNTNAQKTSWSLSMILLPKVLESRDHGFRNLEINQIFPSINGSVDLSYKTINITFYNPVILSNDPRPGYVTIYKNSDRINFRQKIPPTSEFCQISPDGKTININILTSTFNEYNETYYVRMDNNFVKSSLYREPLNGIDDGIWNLISDNKNNLIASYNSSGGAIIGLASITNDAKSKFLSFSKSKRSNFFDQLLNEIAEKTPVRRERLSTDEKFQYINHGERIIFSIKIELPIDLNENTADSVLSDLNNLIIRKQITRFSIGNTNDLDNNFGFVILNDFWTTNLTLITVSIIILVMIMYLYIFTYKPLCHLDPKVIEVVHEYTSYAIIAINFFFLTYFVFINTQDKPELFLPSVIIWGIQVGINLIMVIAIFFYLARPTQDELNKTHDNFGAETKGKFDKLKEQFEKLKEQFEKFKKFFDSPTEEEEEAINYSETKDETGDISIKNLLTIEIPGKNDSDPNEKDSDKPSNEDMNEKAKEVDVKVKEVDEINEKALEIIEQIFEMIPKTSSSIIKDIFEGDNLYNGSEISSDVQSKINEKMFEILRKISIKISQKSSDVCYVDNILSANISTKIKVVSKPEQTQLTTKINLLKEIKSPDIKRIIFAEIHIETAMILLRKLFDVLLEKFGVELQNKISNAILDNIPAYIEMKKEEIRKQKLEKFAEDVTKVPNQISEAEKKMKENSSKISEGTKKVLPKNSDEVDKIISGVVNETGKVNKFVNDLKISNKKEKTDDESNGKADDDSNKKEKADNETSKIVKKAEEMSIEISKKIKDEISKNIQEKIEEIFYNILNEVYYNINMDDKPVTSNEGQTSSKKIQDDDKTDVPGQETSNKGQSFSENMQNDQSYDIKINDEPVTSNEEQASSKNIQDDDKTVKQFSENIQNDQSIITYKIDEIRKIFSKIKKEKIDIISKDENVLAKSLKDNLTESLKEILTKEESKDLDVEHIIFIICAILDSESLLFIDNISRDYTKKLKSHVKESEHIPDHIKDNIKDYVKKFIVIRVLIEVIFKNLPLLIIMAIYTSEIVPSKDDQT
ncbi:hypothetical protein F8M41_018264 [Gigaspora margarita]|uniref:Uncharacterized protein n=1 Tax=Gigaspora margarita TaxID=4874 RepID=A0A8H4ELF6_GIGMA|nr:hypothetical protein F8M41_018264 [Gigaspora margarita]